MKKIITALVVTLLLTVSLAVAADKKGDGESARKGKEVYEYKTSKGTVKFPHWTHMELTDNCKTCHHRGGKPLACFKCHTRYTKVKLQNALHGTCIKCHEKSSPDLAQCSVCHNK